MNNRHKNNNTIDVSSRQICSLRLYSKDNKSLNTLTQNEKFSLFHPRKSSHIKLISNPNLKKMPSDIKEKIRINNSNKHNYQRSYNLPNSINEDVSIAYYQQIIKEKNKEIEELKKEITNMKIKMNISYIGSPNTSNKSNKRIRLRIFQGNQNGSIEMVNNSNTSKINIKNDLNNLKKRCQDILKIYQNGFSFK